MTSVLGKRSEPYDGKETRDVEGEAKNWFDVLMATSPAQWTKKFKGMAANIQERVAAREAASSASTSSAGSGSTSSATSGTAEEVVWKKDKEDGRYEFSSDGRVRRVGKTEPLKTFADASGHTLFARVDEPNKTRTRKLGLAVCTAFHGPRPSKKHVTTHLDGDHGNNCPDNLAWRTTAETVALYQRKGQRRVRQLGLDGVEIRTFDSLKSASVHSGARVTSIQSCCAGRNKTSCGFRWQYIDAGPLEASVMEGEEWRDFPAQLSCPNYAISSLGRVKNTARNRIRSTTLLEGYKNVQVRNTEHKAVSISVHRVVALAFLDEPGKDETTVDHINRQRLDNRRENLRWMSAKANATAATGKKVEKCDLFGKLLETYPSVREAARFVQGAKNEKAAAGGIRACAHERAETAYGFKWRFAEAAEESDTETESESE